MEQGDVLIKGVFQMAPFIEEDPPDPKSNMECSRDFNDQPENIESDIMEDILLDNDATTQ